MLACTLGRAEDSKYKETKSGMSCSSLFRADITHIKLLPQTHNCPCIKAAGRAQVTAMNLLGRWREEAVTFLLPPDAKRRAE